MKQPSIFAPPIKQTADDENDDDDDEEDEAEIRTRPASPRPHDSSPPDDPSIDGTSPDV
jgi:hypothetical protein